MQVQDQGINEGDNRNTEDRTRNSGNHRSRCHAKQNNQGVQRHRVGHEKRLQQIPFDLLDDQNNHQHDQTDGKSLINHRNKDSDNSREQ